MPHAHCEQTHIHVVFGLCTRCTPLSLPPLYADIEIIGRPHDFMNCDSVSQISLRHISNPGSMWIRMMWKVLNCARGTIMSELYNFGLPSYPLKIDVSLGSGSSPDNDRTLQRSRRRRRRHPSRRRSDSTVAPSPHRSLCRAIKFYCFERRSFARDLEMEGRASEGGGRRASVACICRRAPPAKMTNLVKRSPQHLRRRRGRDNAIQDGNRSLR